MNYTQSLIKGNQTLTKKVEELKKELSECKIKYDKERIKNAILQNDNYNYKLQVEELKDRIKELESIEKDPIGSLLKVRRRLGM